jgi:hypothetical protein
MYACIGFAPKGPRDGFSTITCQEKREETRTIEAETGSQRSPRHNGRPQKGSTGARSEITAVPACGLMEPPQARAFVRLASVENPTARDLHSERLYDPQGNGFGYSFRKAQTWRGSAAMELKPRRREVRGNNGAGWALSALASISIEFNVP